MAPLTKVYNVSISCLQSIIITYTKYIMFTDLFWKLPGYSLFPHRQIKRRMVKTWLIVNINPIRKRYSLDDKSMFTHFYLCQEKKYKPGFYLQQAGNRLLNMFFHRGSYKTFCFSELACNSSVLMIIC